MEGKNMESRSIDTEVSNSGNEPSKIAINARHLSLRTPIIWLILYHTVAPIICHTVSSIMWLTL